MSFFKASIIVGVLMLLGRISGFIRELIVAGVSGATQQSDVIIILFTFPDLMLNLFLSGGLTTALVPTFRSLPAAAVIALAMRASLLIAIYFTILALLIALFASNVLGFLAPGWPQDVIMETTFVFRVTLIALPVAALSGVVVAFLDSQERFAFGAVGTLIFNVSIILSLLLFASVSSSLAVSIGVIGGALLRLAIQLMASMTFWQLPDFSVPYNRSELLERFFASFGFFSLLILLPPVARAYASTLEPGALSLFNYAHKLMELPIGIIVTAIATVLLPRLSGYVHDNAYDGAKQTVGNAVRVLFILLSLISVATMFQSQALVRLVFFGAEFNQAQFAALASLLSLGMFGLPFQGLVLLYGSVFASYNHTNKLVLGAVMMVVSMLVLSYFLQSLIGTRGLMISYAGTQAIGAFILSLFLIRLTGPSILRIIFHRPLLSIILPLLSCLVMSWLFQKLQMQGLLALVLSSGLALIVYIMTDKELLKSLSNRRKSN